MEVTKDGIYLASYDGSEIVVCVDNILSQSSLLVTTLESQVEKKRPCIYLDSKALKRELYNWSEIDKIKERWKKEKEAKKWAFVKKGEVVYYEKDNDYVLVIDAISEGKGMFSGIQLSNKSEKDYFLKVDNSWCYVDRLKPLTKEKQNEILKEVLGLQKIDNSGKIQFSDVFDISKEGIMAVKWFLDQMALEGELIVIKGNQSYTVKHDNLNRFRVNERKAFTESDIVNFGGRIAEYGVHTKESVKEYFEHWVKERENAD